MSEGNGAVTRDSIRGSLLKNTKRVSRIYETPEGDRIEIRQPTVGQRGRILKAAGITGAKTDIEDITAMQVAAIVECCFMPGTNEKIFEWTDEEVLRSLPSTSWFDEVANEAMATMNQDAVEAGKPLRETEND